MTHNNQRGHRRRSTIEGGGGRGGGWVIAATECGILASGLQRRRRTKAATLRNEGTRSSERIQASTTNQSGALEGTATANAPHLRSIGILLGLERAVRRIREEFPLAPAVPGREESRREGAW